MRFEQRELVLLSCDGGRNRTYPAKATGLQPAKRPSANTAIVWGGLRSCPRSRVIDGIRTREEQGHDLLHNAILLRPQYTRWDSNPRLPLCKSGALAARRPVLAIINYTRRTTYGQDV